MWSSEKKASLLFYKGVTGKRMKQTTTAASPSSISAREAEKGGPKPVRDVLLPAAGGLREELPNDIKEMILQRIEGMPVDLCRSGLQRACANAMRQTVPNEDLQHACDAEFHALCQTGIDDPNNVHQVARPYLCNLVRDAQGAWVTGPGGDYNPYDMTGWNDAEAMYRWVRQFGLFCAIEHVRTTNHTTLQRQAALSTLRAFGTPQLHRIPDGVFSRFPALDIDKLPDSILEIGSNAFDLCLGIWRMRLPDGLIHIRGAAFGECRNLRRINLPDSLMSIERHAFYHCRSLKEIALPPNIHIIDFGVFTKCTNLETVTLSPQTQQIRGGAFADCTALRRINLPDSLTSIEPRAFRNCRSLKEIALPPNIHIIYNGVFMGCTNLETVTLSPQTQQIREAAFRDCNALRRVELPDSLTRIEPHAFHNCRSLKEIALPPNIHIIDSGVFMGCTNLETVTLSPQTRQIRALAFADCTALRRVELPDSMRFLQYDQGFDNCHPDLVLVYEGREYPANDRNGVYPEVMRHRK